MLKRTVLLVQLEMLSIMTHAPLHYLVTLSVLQLVLQLLLQLRYLIATISYQALRQNQFQLLLQQKFIMVQHLQMLKKFIFVLLLPLMALQHEHAAL